MRKIKYFIIALAFFSFFQSNAIASDLNPLEQMMSDIIVDTFGGNSAGNTNNQSHQWVCSWCGASATSSNTPSKNGCPANGQHGWINVGNTGRNTFICNRCGAVVHTQYKPNSATCRGGGRSGYHQWIQR